MLAKSSEGRSQIFQLAFQDGISKLDQIKKITSASPAQVEPGNPCSASSVAITANRVPNHDNPIPPQLLPRLNT